jgi:hypothetical protein
VGPDASTSQTFLALSNATPGEASSQPSGSRPASDDGGSEAALVPDWPHGCKESGTTAARACSSSRCFFFLIAKSFKDILTFGVACGDGGGGGDAAGRGDEGPGGGGGSASGRGPRTDEVWRVGLGDSTRLIGRGCRRRKGSEEEESDCGEGERGRWGVGSESRRSWSTSIRIALEESASGERAKVGVIDKKEDVKVDNLGESGDELEECEAVGDSNDKLANGVEGDGEAGGSDVWALDKDGSDGSLLVRTRGELEGRIDETVVGSRLAGIGGGGISFVSETSYQPG